MNTNFDPTIVFLLNGGGVGGKIVLKRGSTTLKSGLALLYSS